jgi:beta-lactamase regulating signal transducer with metallopeptidase domain
MESLFLECAVRAALLVGVTAIVLHLMRVKAAATKHCLWAGVMAGMLLLPLWITLGPKVSLPVLPPLAQRIAGQTRAPLEISFDVVVPTARVDRKEAVYLGIYLLGACFLLLRLVIGTIRSRKLVRSSILHDGVRSSSLCAAPITVGFLNPRVILPTHWVEWPRGQLDAVMTHESEHARRRHPLIQWLALLNRALFWFHPLAWWLEHHLSTLAEETCDSVVLARGYDPRTYSEYLIDVARSVKRSGARLTIAGLAMPGSSLARRIQRILDSGSLPRISRPRMALVSITCIISCTAIAAGRLDHAKSQPSAKYDLMTLKAAPAVQPAKFVLGDLKIDSDVPDRDGVTERVLEASKSREWENRQNLTDEVAERIRADFQHRGYFLVVVQVVSWQPIGLTDDTQSIRVIASITPGDLFWLRTINIQSAAPGQTLSISAKTLRDQFYIRDGDLFNSNEIREGLTRLRQLLLNRGYADAIPIPDTKVDRSTHRIDLTIRITEEPHTP